MCVGYSHTCVLLLINHHICPAPTVLERFNLCFLAVPLILRQIWIYLVQLTGKGCCTWKWRPRSACSMFSGFLSNHELLCLGVNLAPYSSNWTIIAAECSLQKIVDFIQLSWRLWKFRVLTLVLCSGMDYDTNMVCLGRHCKTVTNMSNQTIGWILATLGKLNESMWHILSWYVYILWCPKSSQRNNLHSSASRKCSFQDHYFQLHWSSMKASYLCIT